MVTGTYCRNAVPVREMAGNWKQRWKKAIAAEEGEEADGRLPQYNLKDFSAFRVPHHPYPVPGGSPAFFSQLPFSSHAPSDWVHR
jgi:hypothetical protein